MPDHDLSAPVASAPNRWVSQGPVMPIGGAEDTEPGSESWSGSLISPAASLSVLASTRQFDLNTRQVIAA
jgi:hypothetical protein